jgi:hypothetical protein
MGSIGKDEKTKAELKEELAALRAQVAELEALEAERRRAEQVQDALYRIAGTASAAQDMPEFYAAIHSSASLWNANKFSGCGRRCPSQRPTTSLIVMF